MKNFSTLKNRDILVFSFSDWDQEMVSNRYHMMTRLAKNNRVFFFERPINIYDWRRFPELFVPVRKKDNLYLISVPDGFGAQVKKQIYENNIQQIMNFFQIREPIFWFYNYQLGHLIDTFKPRLSVYHCTEDYANLSLIHSSYNNVVNELLEIEKDFVQKNNLVFTVSKALYNRHKKSKINTIMTPNSVDYDLYQKAQKLQGKRFSSKITIGCSGNFSTKIDFELLEYLATNFTDCQFVLIGPIVVKSSIIKKLRSMVNVKFVKKQSVEKLVYLLSKVDVLLIPYIQDEWFCKVSQPLRLHEYLATGKPIVSTPMDCLNKIQDLVYVGSTKVQIKNQLKKAIKEKNDALRTKRIKLAQENTWDKVFLRMSHEIVAKLQVEPEAAIEPYKTSYIKLKNQLTWFFDQSDFPKFDKVEVIKNANEILKHNFTVLNKKHSFSQKIDWSSAFDKDKTWAKGYFEKLNQETYNNGFQNPLYIGDVKLPWEFNKHLHFIILAQAYTATGDEKYTQEFIDQILDWINENPYEYNQPWTQTLIVSHRVIAWVVALGVFRTSNLLTEEIWFKIFISLDQHADYIEKHYEIGERASNHLLGNLAAQIVVCSVFPEISGSNMKIARALKMLADELDKQIYPDGADYEQSLSYHRVILEFLLLLGLLNHKKIIKIPVKIINIIKKMTQFLQFSAQPSGYYQPISDADGARVFMVNNNVLDTKPYLDFAAKIFGQKIYQIKQTSKEFTNSGYCFLRKDWGKKSAWMFFDAGPISMGCNDENLELGTHGHSDTLNFGLALGEQTVITDIGSYAYTTERPFHHYFRSGFGHNIPIVDGQDENILTDYPWVMKQVAQGRKLKSKFTRDIDYVSGEHNGYKRLKNPVSLKREIIFHKKENWAAIIDTFDTTGSHEIMELLHLFPGLNAIKKKDHLTIKSLNFVIKPMYDFEVEQVFGQNKPVEGWYALDFGLKVSAEVIKIKTKINGTTRLVTLLNWGKVDIKLEQVEKILKKMKGKNE